MGIHDRDYMQESRPDYDPIGKLIQLIILALLLFASLRFPIPLVIKLPVAIGFCFLIYRTVSK